MTREDMIMRVLKADPGELSRLSAFIGNGFKANAAPASPAKSREDEPALITGVVAMKKIGCSRTTLWRLVQDGTIARAPMRNKSGNRHQKIVTASVNAYILNMTAPAA